MRGPAGRLLAAAALAVLAACEPAAPGVRVAGDCFVIEGEFWRPEFERFERLYNEHPAIRCLELRGSPGGATAAGLLIGELARARGMTTVARGACVSACALGFLGGAERQLGPSWRGVDTYLQLHGSFDRHTGQPDALFRDAIADWITQRTEGRMPLALVRAVVEAPVPSAGLYVSAGRAPGAARWCGAGGAKEAVCTPLPGADAVNLGLVTRAASPSG